MEVFPKTLLPAAIIAIRRATISEASATTSVGSRQIGMALSSTPFRNSFTASSGTLSQGRGGPPSNRLRKAEPMEPMEPMIRIRPGPPKLHRRCSHASPGKRRGSLPRSRRPISTRTSAAEANLSGFAEGDSAVTILSSSVTISPCIRRKSLGSNLVK